MIDLMASCRRDLQALLEVAITRWNLAGASDWSADLAAGTLTFAFADHQLVGSVELLGSYGASSRTWM